MHKMCLVTKTINSLAECLIVVKRIVNCEGKKLEIAERIKVIQTGIPHML